MPCNCCQITDQAFGEADARTGLKSYRRSGAGAQTRLMLKAIRSRGLRRATLLDIGGGVGAIHHELMDDVVDQATHVDASRAYLKVAQQEASRRGHTDRVRFVQADFTDVAPEMAPADIVTLDRVVCCYPDYRSLLAAAAGRSTHLLALSYPREVWYVKGVMRIMNFFQSLRRDPFRVFVHPVKCMDEVLMASGMRRVSLKRLFVWEVALYTRK